MQNIKILCFLFLAIGLQAQVVITNPAFPTQTSTVTLTYDATKGNGALKDVPGTVYAHTGLITNTSTSANDWKFVQGTWGTADAKVAMTAIGNNKHTLTINIGTFYGYPANITVFRLAFVFRNANGTIVGRATDGSDIFYDIYPNDNALRARFFEPEGNGGLVASGATIPILAGASQSGSLKITDNGTQVANASGTTISHNLVAGSQGLHTVILEAVAGANVARDTFTYHVPATLVVEDPPAGSRIGATPLTNSSFRLMLHAPGKNSVFVIGSFNDYQVLPNYAMKRSVDGSKWWIDLQNIVPGNYHTYQYLVDGSLRIADPVSTLILDPANDAGISQAVWPGLPAYPTGRTTGHVSVIRAGAPSYPWQVQNFQPPAKTDLVIYECLVRDFLADHSFKSMTDTLDYLKRLGINAIELMPVSEFENNNSWGYNVSYHGALDKYYGSPDRFKALVDAAHARGIAVILDVVYNHAFGQSPLARLYWDVANNRPAANNPWLNPVERHPFNVGFDFNHESQATVDYVITTLQHWLTEYRVDGFRFDLSKGFTQRMTTDVGAWSAYDASRIAILKKYSDALKAAKPNGIYILEHLGDNAEETALQNMGYLLWGNMNFNYNEASMGFSGNDLKGVSHRSRNWTEPNLVGYMESHDEERLMYKNVNFGNSAGSYNIKTLNTALERMELVNAFFLTVPGPKMIWQFGEMGYDFSINTCPNGTINNNCRVDPKPIKWDYLTNAKRKHLWDVVQALIHLKVTQPLFEIGTYNINELGAGQSKAWHINSQDLNMTVLGNFGVGGAALDPKFQHTGTWYDYLTGQTINVTNVNAVISLPPGAFRVYLDKKIELPAGSGLTVSVHAPGMGIDRMQVFPNPAGSGSQPYIMFGLQQPSHLRFSLMDISGRILEQSTEQTFAEGDQITELPWSVPHPGVYLIRVTDAEGRSAQLKWIVQ